MESQNKCREQREESVSVSKGGSVLYLMKMCESESVRLFWLLFLIDVYLPYMNDCEDVLKDM